MVVLVTGGEGQLGRCIADIVKDFDKENKYIFLSKDLFDLTKKEQMIEQFERFKPEIVINCAAYTKVDEAEDNYYEAHSINAEGVQDLVSICKEFGAYIIHISTDYVFDGRKKTPYSEEDKMHPLNYYGDTKMIGESYVLEYKKGIVIRTSWLYSEYGKNFYRTMIERIKNRCDTNVVCDQLGTPTYANDLAFFIVYGLIKNKKIFEKNGLYNFSNEGIASWYDFASAIETIYSYFGPYLGGINYHFKHYIERINSSDYKTKAKRPSYSVLDKTKVKKEFSIKIPHWMDSLVRCMKNDKIIK